MGLSCVYTDLDGTLLGRGSSLFRDAEGGFSLAQARGLEACHRAGVEVVIMSGRREPQVHELARIMGQKLTELWGQPVVISNVAGAGGSIGASRAAKAPADGHTWLMTTNSPLTTNLALYKSLDYDTPVPAEIPATQPHFESPRGPSVELIKLLREKSPLQISELMHLSDKLSALNVARYQAWAGKSTPKNARQAAFAFDGDVYGGLDARSLTPTELAWAQEHVCILSGLYGLLRPLDLLQPYRLEMGTPLANRHGKDLYAFWGSRIAEHLNERLAADRTPVVVNVASQEYFKSVDRKALKAKFMAPAVKQ